MVFTKSVMTIPDEVTEIIWSIIFMSSFIIIFFFTYVSRLERHIVETQSRQLVYELTSGLRNFANQDVNRIIYNMAVADPVANVKSTTTDERILRTNRMIRQNAVVLVSVGNSILLVTAMIITLLFDVDWKTILWTQMWILVTIVLTEFLFADIIAQNYISFDPDYVIEVSLSELLRWRDSQPSSS